MINDAEIIINRCTMPSCRMLAVHVSRRSGMQMLTESAGSAPCERRDDHRYDQWARMTLRRDVLVLQGLWTVGRSIVPGLPSDPTAHILADRLGWSLGEDAALASLPADMHAWQGLTWEAVMLARLVAETTRDQWDVGDRRHMVWRDVAAYLTLWSDRVH